jgi:hypothetical protein
MGGVRSGRRLTFVRLKNVEEFCEARLVRLTGGAIPILLNPFGMLLAQGVMNLVLKLNVRANFARAALRRVHFHIRRYRRLADCGHDASGGFCGATYEGILTPSLEIASSARVFVCERCFQRVLNCQARTFALDTAVHGGGIIGA